jgi:hypothetical protein
MPNEPLDDDATREVRRAAGAVFDLAGRRLKMETMDRWLFSLEVTELAYRALRDPAIDPHPEFR